MNDVVKQAHFYASNWLGEGNVATYIPELSFANPNDLGVAITMVNGESYHYGESGKTFTIQSMCKIILLATALEDSGFDKVFSVVGMEPTGDSFDSIVRLESAVRRPSNPLINAGAIATISCISGDNAEEKFKGIISMAAKLLDNENITYDEKVYNSETKTGDKNRALAYMMKSLGVFNDDVLQLLDAYFKACSILATCREVSVLGSILANNGQNFIGEKVIEPFNVKIIRSLMVTCGMYNSAGEFALRVGVPAKSGVGGGIVAVVPGKMGIATYAPALDAKGNSFCGIKALEFLSNNLNLSIF